MIREQEKKLHEINEQQYRKSQLYIEENKKKIEELKEKVKKIISGGLQEHLDLAVLVLKSISTSGPRRREN